MITSVLASGSNAVRARRRSVLPGYASATRARLHLVDATLLFGSSLACVQTIRSHRRPAPSPPATSWRVRALNAIRIDPARARRETTQGQQRKGETSPFVPYGLFVANSFAPLRGNFVFIMAPNRFALFQKRFHAFVRVLSLHQLVQVNVLLLGQRRRSICRDRGPAIVSQMPATCQRALSFASTSSSLGSR